jgi:hypothetical protein
VQPEQHLCSVISCGVEEVAWLLQQHSCEFYMVASSTRI